MSARNLTRAWFERDAVTLARDLLGMTLVRIDADGARLSGRIVETEAYREGDAASHSFRGRTARNAPMYLAGGHAYVYFIYGMHFCFNIAAETEGAGAAVLIRALRPLDGVARMRARRGDIPERDLCRGPANLCKALDIGRAQNGLDLCANETLWLERAPYVADADARATPRIGISGDARALAAPWRFVVAGDDCVSGRKRQATAETG